jgi:sigma-E factor negative regulatory protein RseC
MNTTGVVVGIEEEKAFVHINRHTACENCGACHCSDNQLNLKVTAVNSAGAVIGDKVELSMENVNFFRASFFLYGVPLVALLIGVFAGFYGFQAMNIAMYDILAILLGLGTMTIAFIIIKLNSEKFAENKKYMSVITNVIQKGEFPVV